MNSIAFHQIQPHAGQVQPSDSSTAPKKAGMFQNLLEQSIEQQNGVKFSSHAIDRLRTRNIILSNDDVIRLTAAVNRAGEKGSRESLVLMNNMAFVVSVKNKTIVTAMTRDQMQEKVITNIDSTIIV